jgi:surfeit locus 1 family protein
MNERDMIRFRPQRAPTFIFLPMLAVCIALGAWQLHRLEWKEDLIARVAEHMQRPIAPLNMALSESMPEDDPLEWRRVTVRGHFIHEGEVYLYARGPHGETGVQVITPFQWDHGLLLVNRGFVPDAKRDPATRVAGQVAGETELTGVIRHSSEGGLFTPSPDLRRRLWFSKDSASMAAATGTRLVVPFFIEADAAPNPGGYPIGGQTIADIPNNHLSYAITWFALALVLLVVYLAYHVKQGRLGRK